MTTEINGLITESALQTGWRFEAIFHLGAMSPDESLPTALEDALDEEIPDIAVAVGISRRKSLDLDKDEFFEHVRRKHTFGFLVQVATPVRAYTGDGDSYFCSWGHYRTHWLYGDDLASLMPKIEAWVNDCCADDRKASNGNVNGVENHVQPS
ncbi:hypothetical protein [Burkholderia contaminans]|uniref:Uncharacterized protein n=1 Tax=Burkholderia contaminans TaxID=488447 RepID=A0A2S5DMA3_9BURK|nr:hypothetical protein [Burkholderia contaminans]POZ80214.1 hypothetical protein C3743_40265 [Burkholderia contaminans]